MVIVRPPQTFTHHTQHTNKLFFFRLTFNFDGSDLIRIRIKPTEKDFVDLNSNLALLYNKGHNF